jgi:hypothetical protein
MKEVIVTLIDAVPIEELLDSLGYSTSAARTQARRTLEDAGLTNPRKKSIHPQKREEVEILLESRFLRYCGSRGCAEKAVKGDRELILVPRVGCEACGGRKAPREARVLASACHSLGFGRILVVGGGPKQHKELRNVVGNDLRIDVIDGERRVDSSRARTLARGADIIIVWGSTILPHKVSVSVKHTEFAFKTLQIIERGVPALLRNATEHCRRRGPAAC